MRHVLVGHICFYAQLYSWTIASALTVVICLDDIPAKVKQASFMWERGAKLQYTEPSPVNEAEHAVYWGNTLLKQVV